MQLWATGKGILQQQSELLPDEAGMIGETIVNLMFAYDRITLPEKNTAVKCIDALYRESLLTQDLVEILYIRRNVLETFVNEEA